MGELQHNREEREYFMQLEDGSIATVNYTWEGKNHMKLVYSYVPPHLRGTGLGRELVLKAFEKLTDEGYTATAICSYIRMVAQRDPKWSKIID